MNFLHLKGCNLTHTGPFCKKQEKLSEKPVVLFIFSVLDVVLQMGMFLSGL